MITAVRRITDNLLADIQNSPNMPADNTPRINNAVAQFGGIAGEWAVVEVPANLWTGVNSLARQFAVLTEGVITGITQSTPPTAATDKTQIDNDGVDKATITCTVGDVAYTGIVKFTAIAPNGMPTSTTKNAVAGVATEELTTTLEGVHRILCETELHGGVFLSVEGI